MSLISRRALLIAAGATTTLAACSSNRSGSAESSGTASPAAPVGGDTIVAQPEVRASTAGVLSTTLTCQSGTTDVGTSRLATMSYEGTIPGPTLRLAPGDSLRFDLINNLTQVTGPGSGSGSGSGNGQGNGQGNGMGNGMQGMAGMDGGSPTTNVHTHGLHVSPAGNSDNVFLEVPEGQTQDYVINIPADHPGGLHWYHPHHHGSVSPQVLAGMSGAIVITGPLDEVPEVKAAQEQILILQRLQPNATMIARMASMHDNAFLSGNGNPVFAVNGQVRPKITMRPGQLQRWRIVMADPIDYFDLALLDDAGNPVPGAMHMLAFDGLTLPSVQTVSNQLVVPGNRLDMLVQAPDQAGMVRLVGRTVPGFGQPDIEFLQVQVAGDPVDMAVPGALPTQLAPISAADVTIRQRVTFGSWNNAMTVNGVNFNDGPDEMAMRVGAVEEWTIENLSDQAHAFHIHTNPYFVVAVNGEPLAEPVYHDTYPIPVATGPESAGSITVRFRPTEFTGRMVQHCHILPHEDAGMMGVVNLV